MTPIDLPVTLTITHAKDGAVSRSRHPDYDDALDLLRRFAQHRGCVDESALSVMAYLRATGYHADIDGAAPGKNEPAPGKNEALAELSRLQLAYEELADAYGYYSNDAVDTAAELSAAVGRYLVEQGYEGVV